MAGGRVNRTTTLNGLAGRFGSEADLDDPPN